MTASRSAIVSDSPRLNGALSGEQVELRSAGAHLTVAQVGASLRRLTIDGADLLDGYGTDEIARFAQGQALVPWPNRLADGRYRFGGDDLQLPLSEPDKRNAIHGLARWSAWEIVEQQADRAALAHVIQPQAGYPFTLALRIGLTLVPDGLTVTLTAQNGGGTALPFGAGFHPYLTVGAPCIDDAELRLPAGVRLEADDRGIPTGRTIAVRGSDFDFVESRRIGDVVLDTAFGDLQRDDEGRAHLSLRGPSGRSLRLWMDHNFRWLMAFTGDSLPDPARQRRALGVEPMTCPPNALQSGEDMVVLAPGQRHTCAWGLAWET